jgi:hypothetical protein
VRDESPTKRGWRGGPGGVGAQRRIMPSTSISARAPILLGFSHVAVRRGRPVMLKAGVCTGARGAPSLVAFGGDVEGRER